MPHCGKRICWMSKKSSATRFVGVSLDQLAPIMSECMELGQEVVLTITGHSMSPFLRNKKDQVVLIPCDPTALQPGDVPLYRRRNGKYVLHRIVERDDGTVRTRYGREEALPSCCDSLQYTMLGDAQWQEEPHIAPDQIVAVATAFISRGKRRECADDAYRRFALFRSKFRTRHSLGSIQINYFAIFFQVIEFTNPIRAYRKNVNT